MIEERALIWNFEDYVGKYVICNYITHKHLDNVIKAFDNLDDAEYYMDEYDLWEDNYLYIIKEDGFAYHPNF